MLSENVRLRVLGLKEEDVMEEIRTYRKRKGPRKS